MNGRILTLLAAVHALVGAALALRQPEVAWLALPLLSLIGAALLRAPSVEALALRAERELEPHVEGGRGTVAVVIRVRNEGAGRVHLRLADAPPADVRIVEGGCRLRAVLAPGESGTLRYAFGAARGRFAWHTVRAVVSDPLDLVDVRLDLPAAGELHVQPPVERVRPVAPSLRRTFPSPGVVPARAGGSGTDFWGLREYQPGDPLRWLDARRAARHPGVLFTREFEQERIADVGLVLDACPLAGATVGGERLLEHEVRATASMAEAFLRQGHRVSLIVLGAPQAAVFPGHGRVQLQRILSCLAGASPRAAADVRLPSRRLLRACPARSLLVFVSTLEEDAFPVLLGLRTHGRQLLVLSPDPILLHPALRERDPLSRLAVRAARIERALALRRLLQLGIRAVDWPVDAQLHPLLRAALAPPRGQGGRA